MKIIQQTNMTHVQMMGYAVVAKSGEVLYIDGGHDGNGGEVRRVIKALGGHVDLWLLTHPHSDHFRAMKEVLENQEGVTFDRLGSGFLPDAWARDNGLDGRTAEQLYEWNAFAETLGDKLFELKPGQAFRLGTMKVEILSGTNPDLLNNAFNNQSCVIRVTEDDFTMLFLGDLGEEAGDRLLATGIDLRADGVQMAHHGQNGVNEAFYRAVGPKFAFWPTPTWLWENRRPEDSEPGSWIYKTPEVIGWMERLGAKNITTFEHTVVFDTDTCEAEKF